jgi:hypothetical protein
MVVLRWSRSRSVGSTNNTTNNKNERGHLREGGVELGREGALPVTLMAGVRHGRQARMPRSARREGTEQVPPHDTPSSCITGSYDNSPVLRLQREVRIDCKLYTGIWSGSLREVARTLQFACQQETEIHHRRSDGPRSDRALVLHSQSNFKSRVSAPLTATAPLTLRGSNKDKVC